MSGPASFTRLIRDALGRHRGIGPLARRLGRILLREGPLGIFSRVGVHARRLSVATPGGAVDTGAAKEAEVPPEQPESTRASRIAAEAPAAGLEPGMLLVGHPYAVLGRAEDIRTAACACDQAAIQFAIRNMLGDYGREEASRHRDFPFFDRVQTAGGYRANLFFLNADEMDTAYRYLGGEVFEGPYNIGCFAWELSRFPEPWVGTLDYFHEIWAPTRFIQQSIAERTRLPVVWMPFAVEPGAPAGMSRGDFGLPGDAYLFLFFFDVRSYTQRKNPWAVMEAFARAFPPGGSAPVHLVIKLNGSDFKEEERTAFMASPLLRDPRVQIIDQVLDDRGIRELVRLCDCFVSLHRSEGFGRGPAEAMYFGKPVIATAYSGNLDFMNPDNACLVDQQLVPVAPGDYPYGEGQLWAEADTGHAVWYMRKLVAEPSYAAQIGGRARDYMRRFHSFQAVGALYRRRLERLGLVDPRS